MVLLPMTGHCSAVDRLWILPITDIVANSQNLGKTMVD